MCTTMDISTIIHPAVPDDCLNNLLTSSQSRLIDLDFESVFNKESFNHFTLSQKSLIANLLPDHDLLPLVSSIPPPSITFPENDTSASNISTNENIAFYSALVASKLDHISILHKPTTHLSTVSSPSHSPPLSAEKSVDPDLFDKNYGIRDNWELYKRNLISGYYEKEMFDNLSKNQDLYRDIYDGEKEREFEEVWGEWFNPERAAQVNNFKIFLFNKFF